MTKNQIKIHLRLFDSFVYTSSSLNKEIMSMRKYCKTPVNLPPESSHMVSCFTVYQFIRALTSF